MCTAAKKYVNLLLVRMVQEKQLEVTILADSVLLDYVNLDWRKEFRKNREEVKFEDVLNRLKFMANRATAQNIKSEGEFQLTHNDRSFGVYLSIGPNDKWFTLKLKEV